MNKFNLFLHVITFVFIAISPDVFAVNCNDESPNLKKEGDSYYDVKDKGPLTRQQRSRIKELFSRFENKTLTGNRSFINCIGPESAAKKTTTKTEITATINQQSDGKIVIKVESFNRKRKTTEIINLSYFGNGDSGEIIKLTKNNLILRNKFRRSAYHAPSLHEEITEISVKKRALTIITTTYRSGYFASHSTIKLHY